MNNIHGSWIYHNEKTGMHEVKVWDEAKRAARVLAEFRTRSGAVQFCITGRLPSFA